MRTNTEKSSESDKFGYHDLDDVSDVREAEFVERFDEVLALEGDPAVPGNVLGHVGGDKAHELSDHLLHQLDDLLVQSPRLTTSTTLMFRLTFSLIFGFIVVIVAI